MFWDNKVTVSFLASKLNSFLTNSRHVNVYLSYSGLFHAP